MSIFRDHSWRPTFAFFLKLDIYGKEIFGGVMMRRVMGVKQYREETREETIDRLGGEAW